MRSFNILTPLLDVRSNSEGSFLSIYLNTEPNQNGKKDFDVFLKKQINDHLAVLDEKSAKRASLEKDAEKIRQYVDSLDPATRSAAIFACSAENEFFKPFEFATPIEENKFFVFDRPFVYPLVRLIDQNPTFAIVAADTNSANILVVKQSTTVRREEIENVKTNRTEVGGWSQARYQRHVENFHQQHAKEVVEELGKITSRDRIDRIVLVGDEAVIIPLLRAELSDELNEKIVGTLSMNVNTPEHELIEAARDAVGQHDALRDKEKIDYVFEVNYDGGVGVTGFEKTLSALYNGQVQELYLSADPDDIVYRREDVKLLLKQYAPGLDGDMPEASERETLIDELIKQAATSAERIRLIEDPHLLKKAGGVGAVLRYQVKGVSN